MKRVTDARAGRSGAEHSICDLTAKPIRAMELKKGLQMDWYWQDRVVDNSMYVCFSGDRDIRGPKAKMRRILHEVVYVSPEAFDWNIDSDHECCAAD